MSKDGAHLRVRVLDPKIRSWRNDKGHGSIASVTVADKSGDAVLACFDGAEALVAKLVKTKVYLVPLASSRIEHRNLKFNRTTTPYEVKLSATDARGVREADSEAGVPPHTYTFLPIDGLELVADGTTVHLLAMLVGAAPQETYVTKRGSEVSDEGLTAAVAVPPALALATAASISSSALTRPRAARRLRGVRSPSRTARGARPRSPSSRRALSTSPPTLTLCLPSRAARSRIRACRGCPRCSLTLSWRAPRGRRRASCGSSGAVCGRRCAR